MKLSEYTDDVYGIIVSLYRNQVDSHNLLKWHTKQAAMQDSTVMYNRTQSFGTQAFNTTKYNCNVEHGVLGSY